MGKELSQKNFGEIARSLLKPQTKGQNTNLFHHQPFWWWIPCIHLVTYALPVSATLGSYTWISLRKNPFVAKFSVKGSLFSETDFSVASWTLGSTTLKWYEAKKRSPSKGTSSLSNSTNTIVRKCIRCAVAAGDRGHRHLPPQRARPISHT